MGLACSAVVIEASIAQRTFSPPNPITNYIWIILNKHGLSTQDHLSILPSGKKSWRGSCTMIRMPSHDLITSEAGYFLINAGRDK